MENQKLVEIFIVIGCITMLFLATMIVAIFNLHAKKILEKDARNKIEKYKAAIEAEEKQKEKTAQNLHDDVIPTLSAIFLSLDKKSIDYANGKFNVVSFQQDIEILDKTIKNIRNISHDLIPLDLVRLGLIKALAYFMERIKETDTSYADFEDKTGFNDVIPFTQTDQVGIYRICLELLNNLMKHARYDYLKVTLASVNNELLIEFQHNGSGMTNAEAIALANSGTGMGLSSVNSRLFLLNGQIDRSKEDYLFYIHLKIPFSL